MEQFIIGAFAAFFLWTVLRWLLPLRLPDWLALVTYGGLAYGVLCIPVHRVTLALACAGGIVFLHLAAGLLGAVPPPPTKVRLPVRRREHSTRREPPSDGRIGQRIPPL